MPFGLTNAPAVFQRLMEKVLAGLNPDEGPDFVKVYIDDVIVFSPTLEDHLCHLERVLEQIRVAGLKLKPSKCRFVAEEVEYLGHILTPKGVKPNPTTISAVAAFPTPSNLCEVRQFLGLSSFYRRFINDFAAIAQPLHRIEPFKADDNIKLERRIVSLLLLIVVTAFSGSERHRARTQVSSSHAWTPTCVYGIYFAIPEFYTGFMAT